MEKRNKGSAQQNYVKPGNDMATSGGKSNDPIKNIKIFNGKTQMNLKMDLCLMKKENVVIFFVACFS